MKQKSIFFLFLIVGVAAVFEACMPEEIEPLARVPVLPAEPYDYAAAPMELHGGFRPFGDSIIDNDVAP